MKIIKSKRTSPKIIETLSKRIKVNLSRRHKNRVNTGMSFFSPGTYAFSPIQKIN